MILNMLFGCPEEHCQRKQFLSKKIVGNGFWYFRKKLPDFQPKTSGNVLRAAFYVSSELFAEQNVF